MKTDTTTQRITKQLVIYSLLIWAIPSHGNDSTTLNVNLNDITKSIELTLGGWMRIDYGVGNDRYGKDKGGDRLGVSQYAFVTDVKFDENISFVSVVGGTVFSDGANEEFEIRDAFLKWETFLSIEGLTLQAGAQPLLFGLKPNGYPGDRSLQASVEYGAGQLFAVSQQAGPSIIGNYEFSPFDSDTDVTISIGAFDHDTENTTMTDGSNLSNNYFAQLKLDDLVVNGLYCVVGFENRYVGGIIDSSESIVDTGIGFKTDFFDISAEYIRLDQDIIGGILDDEDYIVAEITLTPIENLAIYADWAEADESEIETMRIGISYDHKDWLNYKLEWSEDDIRIGKDPESVDFRVSLSF